MSAEAQAAAPASPFAGANEQAVKFAPEVKENATSDMSTSKSFKLVASPSGKDLYVEATKEYDPLAPHRPRDSKSNKGEGMAFMFACFGCCTAKTQEAEEAIPETADRHYSLPAAQSAGNLASSKQE